MPFQNVEPKVAPKRVAKRYAAYTPTRYSSQGGHESEVVVLENQVAGKRQDPFVRSRNADNSEHQQRKQRGISVLADPLCGELIHRNPFASQAT